MMARTPAFTPTKRERERAPGALRFRLSPALTTVLRVGVEVSLGSVDARRHVVVGAESSW